MSNITNRRLVSTDGPDFYPTPPWGTRALLHYESFEGSVLEPCCGDGAMSEVLKAAGLHVISSDLHDRGYGYQGSFFKIKRRFDNVVTNPPFNIAEEIFAHAQKVATRKIALFLRTAFVESVSRYDTIFSKTPPTRLLFFSKRISLYPASQQGVKAGGTTSYAWFIWDLENPSDQTTCRWIDPRFEGKKK